jgi:hypothetical protein
MKIQFAFAVLLAIAASSQAQQTLDTLDWKAISESGKAFPGEVVTVDGKPALKISATNDNGLHANLLTLTKPAITKTFYAITGEIKYENVSGDGYLEMWNYFPPVKAGAPEGQFFSRTLGDSGEMGKIRGTSGWRRFTLPFDRTGSSGAPTRLQINLILPGQGTVYVSSLKLVQYESNHLGAAIQGSWWSNRDAGLIGGIGGSLIGCFGALLGWLTSKGRARSFVVASVQIMAALGILLTIVGLIALGLKQPYAVWYPLLLGGIILGCSLFQLPSLQRRYAELELRRMNSMDAMAS